MEEEKNGNGGGGYVLPVSFMAGGLNPGTAAPYHHNYHHTNTITTTTTPNWPHHHHHHHHHHTTTTTTIPYHCCAPVFRNKCAPLFSIHAVHVRKIPSSFSETGGWCTMVLANQYIGLFQICHHSDIKAYNHVNHLPIAGIYIEGSFAYLWSKRSWLLYVWGGFLWMGFEDVLFQVGGVIVAASPHWRWLTGNIYCYIAFGWAYVPTSIVNLIHWERVLVIPIPIWYV